MESGRIHCESLILIRKAIQNTTDYGLKPVGTSLAPAIGVDVLATALRRWRFSAKLFPYDKTVTLGHIHVPVSLNYAKLLPIAFATTVDQDPAVSRIFGVEHDIAR